MAAEKTTPAVSFYLDKIWQARRVLRQPPNPQFGMFPLQVIISRAL